MVQKWFHCGNVVSGQVDLYMTVSVKSVGNPGNFCTLSRRLEFFFFLELSHTFFGINFVDIHYWTICYPD